MQTLDHQKMSVGEDGNGACSIATDSLLELSRLAEQTAKAVAASLAKAAALMIETLRGGGKILTCGNGGSAADAQHFVGELVGSFLMKRPPLAAIALSADTSVLTAIGNDYGFDTVFARQVESLGVVGDVLVAFSTSGRSRNVLLAFETAKRMNMRTVAIVGLDRNPVLDLCDVCISVPSKVTPRIQEMHTAILHAICEEVEKVMFLQRLD